MDLPDFKPWTPWPKREAAAGIGYPGVYALARFDDGPPPVVDLLDPNIVYFGETCDQLLTGRWYQFNRSAFMQKAGHSGGWNFAACFMDNLAGDPPPWLYVAAYPVDLKPPHCAAYIRHVERWLIWEYVQRHGRLPACNKK